MAWRPPSNQTTALPSFASSWACASVSPSPFASRIEMSWYFLRSLKFSGAVMIAAICGRPSDDFPISTDCMRSDSWSIFFQYARNWS